MICAHCKERDVDLEHVRSHRLINPDTFTHMHRIDNEGNRIGPDIPIARASGPDPMKEAMVGAQASAVGPWITGKPCPFPQGRYAILDDGVTKFYKVDVPTEGKWTGYVFVKVQASDDFHNIRGREAREHIVNEIAKDPEAAMLLYGRELGKCGHCGRTLTDEDSRARGIGPICAGKVAF